MTRLMEEDIESVSRTLFALDEKSRELIGADIADVARASASYTGDGAGMACAVVPVTAGLGVIGNFSESCRAILEHCGANAFVTRASDVAGVQEAYARGAQMVFLADDDICMLSATDAPVFSDNGEATGRAFAEALIRMTQEDEALVLGAGPVGSAAAGYLVEHGYCVSVYDLDAAKAQKLSQACGASVEADGSCVGRFRAILDATCTGGFIGADDIQEGTVLSAPGMPLCVTPDAAAKVSLFHNPLELGVTAMYFECLRKRDEWLAR